MKKSDWQITDRSNVVPTQVVKAWTAEGAKLQVIQNTLEGNPTSKLDERVRLALWENLQARRGYVIQGEFVPAQ